MQTSDLNDKNTGSDQDASAIFRQFQVATFSREHTSLKTLTEISWCLHEKTRTGASLIPRWLFDFVSRLHVASHAGVFRGARILSLATNACSTEDNIPFPRLANHVVLSKFWKVDLDRKITR